MPRSLLVLFSLCLVTACGERAGSELMHPQHTDTVLEAEVQAITKLDGETLVELNLGSIDNLELGTFLRIYADANAGSDPLIKGVVQVSELLGDQRSLARSIYLYDPKLPFAVGDRVRETRLAAFADPQAILENTDRQLAEASNADAAERNAYQRLREEFQRRLDQQAREQAARIAELETQHANQRTTLSASHERALERLRLEHRSDLAALRSTLTTETSAAVDKAQAERQEHIRDLEIERQRMRLQIDALLQREETLKEELRRAKRSIAETKQDYRQQLEAEAETREVLERRLADMERIIAGQEAESAELLSHAPERSETILERLERIAAERDQARKHIQVLEAQLKTLRDEAAVRTRQHEELQTSAQTAQRRLQLLQSQIANQNDNLATIESLRQRIAALEEHIDAVTVARLEAERNLYHLASQVMHLDGDPDSIRSLQHDLQRRFMPSGETAPADSADSAEETP